MLKARQDGGKLVIAPEGSITSANAPEVENRVLELLENHPCQSLEIDCDRLAYSSSAGLRIILRLKKKVDDTVLTNVHPELYDILDMTGFTEMMSVQKACRVISVKDCEVIGQGSNGRIYRIDPDTIVKVYLDPDALPEIRRERELARMAFVAGVPTAIPYDVVRIEGGGYGSVFEMLNADSFDSLIRSGQKSADEVAEMSISLLKLIHSRTVHSDILPDMKATALGWAAFLKDYLPADQAEKLYSLISAVPEDDHLMHGDYHVKNIMLQNGESLLIDMDTLCHGHPIFELASMYNAYEGFGLSHPYGMREFLGLPFALCVSFWRKSLALYLDTRDESRIREVEDKAKIVGMTRIMRREIRRGGLSDPEGQVLIDICRKTLAELLPRTDTLEF